MKELSKLMTIMLFLLSLFLVPFKSFGDETSSTVTIFAASESIELKGTTSTFSSIAGANIEGTSFSIDTAPVVAIEVINNTTQTEEENYQGKTFPSGVTLEIQGGVNILQPPGTLKTPQRSNFLINKFGYYELDTRNLTILKPKLVSSATPGIDIKVFFTYSNIQHSPLDNLFSENYPYQ